MSKSFLSEAEYQRIRNLPRMKFYHGGAPGLRMVLPSGETGASSTADHGAEGVCRRDRVYVTNNIHDAAFFAAMHPSDKGVVYEVEPIGELEADPDFTPNGDGSVSMQCKSAKVIQKFRMKHKDRMRIRRTA